MKSDDYQLLIDHKTNWSQEAKKESEPKKESSKPKTVAKSSKTKAAKEVKKEESEEVDEEELLKQQHQQKRSRTHIDDILRVYEIGSQDVRLCSQQRVTSTSPLIGFISA